MTMITKRLAAVAAGAVPSLGICGPKRAGDRLAGSKRARPEQSSPSFADPTRKRGRHSGRDDEINRAAER